MSGKAVKGLKVEYLQVMDYDGNVDKKLMPALSHEQIKELYGLMVLIRTFDDKAFSLQRQGRLGSYLQARGQEASQVGPAYVLEERDWIFPSYRESGALITRGHPMHMVLQYWGGDERGLESPEGLNNFPITIAVGTHIPHGVGVAWASKMLKEEVITMTFFGDGATSKGDFHEGLNFAGNFQVPAVFICQNNGFAISLPRDRQTASETIAQKAISYGFCGIQVDGNDIFAVYRAAKDAVDRARKGKGPTLIECVTYRIGDHSTSDDASRYRKKDEVEEWRKKDPIERLERYMRKSKVLNDKYKESVVQRSKEQVDKAVQEYEEILPPSPADIFENTYSRLTRRLEEQADELKGQ
ncbi:MAG: pyruvate dehydrogenase (acetyl-transferring) E1 component subunit alpha [Planctomycetes bacterium]|nr:pyruvate dehydrogenase (acetyl-transferring) E1 component subunit alpha [Planctomycetota bacterium]